MSLLSWLGKEAIQKYETKEPMKVDPRSLSPVFKRSTPDRIVLGVLGTRSNMRYEDAETDLLCPILEAWGTPDEIVVPAEGDSSFILQTWAKQKDIPVRLLACNWTTKGKRAGLLRDSQIQRESTHMLLLQGPRSNALTQLAQRLERKGRPVVISERPGEPVKSVSTM
jgi:hypothetical protein